MSRSAWVDGPKRRRIQRLYSEGVTQAEIARRTGLHPSTISKVLSGKGGSRRFAFSSIIPGDLDAVPSAVERQSDAKVEQWMQEHPPPAATVADLYPDSIRDRLDPDHPNPLTPAELWHLTRTVPAINDLCDVLSFARTHFPELHPHQLLWLAWVAKRNMALILAPPRHGKSHVVSLVLVIWLLCGGGNSRSYYANPDASLRDNQIMLVSSSEGNAQKNFLAIEARLSDGTSTFVQTYGRFRRLGLPWSQSKGAFIVDGRRRTELSGDWSLVCVGCRSRVLGRGARWIILDDVADLDNCKTIDHIDAIFRWLQGQIFSRLDDIVGAPGCIWGVGHHLPLANDLYTRLCQMVDLEAIESDDAKHTAEPNPIFDTIIQPAIMDWSNREVLCPERMSWRQLMAARNRAPDTFAAMYQQQPIVEGTVFCRIEWIKGEPVDGVQFPGCLDLDRIIGQSSPRSPRTEVPPLRIVSVDPSPTKFWGIICMDLLPSSDYSPILLDLHRSKMLTYQFVRLLEDWMGRYDFSILIIEKNSAVFLIQDPRYQAFLAMHPRLRVIYHDTAGNKGDTSYGEGSLPEDIQAGRIRIPYGDELSRRTFSTLINELTDSVNTNDTRMALWLPKWHYRGLVSVSIEASKPRLETVPEIVPPYMLTDHLTDAELNKYMGTGNPLLAAADLP